ncbi:hypothetical protein FRC11_006850 [Ceratobasidium sp. 423]|nr:hypothetical protein FRC11_006850 [Ceratobasidium sp. 423]
MDEPEEVEDLICDVLSIVNGRFAEMIEGWDRRVYITTLFLNPNQAAPTTIMGTTISGFLRLLRSVLTIPNSFQSPPKDAVAPAVRYRDLSDLIKKGEAKPREPVVESDAPKAGTEDPKYTKSTPSAEADPMVTELCDEEDRWEEEWELDDVI